MYIIIIVVSLSSHIAFIGSLNVNLNFTKLETHYFNAINTIPLSHCLLWSQRTSRQSMPFNPAPYPPGYFSGNLKPIISSATKRADGKPPIH